MKQTQSPPSPREKHWLLGHVPKVMKDLLGYFGEVQKEYGDYVRLKAPVKAGEMYLIFEAEGVRHVLQTHNRKYGRGEILRIIKPLVGDGLVTSEGDFWRKQRRLIQPMFHKQQIANMMQEMAHVIEELMNEWEDKYPDGTPVDLTHEMDKLALRVVSRSLFKTNLDRAIPIIDEHLNLVMDRFMNRFKNPVLYATWIPTPANRKERSSIEAIIAIVQQFIEDKKSGKMPYQGDILDLLLAVEDADTGEKMSAKQIQDELVTMLLAGHETTAHAMAYATYLLTEHPEVQERLVTDLEESDIAQNPAAIRQIPYLQQVVNETLRLYPPAFMVQRRALEDDVINGYAIPKGVNVYLPIYNVHRIEKYWPDPLRFDPDRFSPEAKTDLPKFAYFPFSGGPHQCIGDQFAQAEMSLLLAKLFQRFTFRNPDGYKLEVMAAMSLQPKENIVLHLYRKDKKESL